jgi:hypothetical protein
MRDRRLTLACVVLATIAAFLMRAGFPYVWYEAGAPASVFYQGDTRAFLAYAAALVAGRPFDNGIPFHPPGWPFVLSLFYRLLGFSPLTGHPISPEAIKLFVAALSALSVGLSTLLAGELAGTGAMLAAALLGTFHFGHIVEGTVPNSEALYGLLLVVALFLTWRWMRVGDDRSRRSLAWPLALGAIAGCATLVRAEFGLCAALLLIPVVLSPWRSRGAREDLTRRRGENKSHDKFFSAASAPPQDHRLRVRRLLPGVAAFAIGICVVMLPSTIAHWRSLSAFNAEHRNNFPGPLPTFAPVTSYGAFNFAMGNHANADGSPNRDHPLLSTCPPEQANLLAGGQLDLSCPAVYDLFVHGYRIGLAWIAENPGRATALLLRKASMTAGVLALGYFDNDFPAGVEGTRRRVDLLDPASRVLWPIHLALILAGLFLLRHRPHVLLLLAAPLVTLAASALMFYGYVRLGAAYLPVLWVFQGTALAALAARVVRQPRIRQLAPALVLAAGLIALAFQALTVAQPHRVTIDGPRGPGGEIVQDETVRITRVR